MQTKFKALCREKGINQKELSSKLGVSAMTLSRASKENTSIRLIFRIANELNVETCELFTPSTEKRKNDSTCLYCGGKIKISKE